MVTANLIMHERSRCVVSCPQVEKTRPFGGVLLVIRIIMYFLENFPAMTVQLRVCRSLHIRMGTVCCVFKVSALLARNWTIPRHERRRRRGSGAHDCWIYPASIPWKLFVKSRSIWCSWCVRLVYIDTGKCHVGSRWLNWSKRSQVRSYSKACQTLSSSRRVPFLPGTIIKWVINNSSIDTFSYRNEASSFRQHYYYHAEPCYIQWEASDQLLVSVTFLTFLYLLETQGCDCFVSCRSSRVTTMCSKWALDRAYALRNAWPKFSER